MMVTFQLIAPENEMATKPYGRLGEEKFHRLSGTLGINDKKPTIVMLHDWAAESGLVTCQVSNTAPQPTSVRRSPQAFVR